MADAAFDLTVLHQRIGLCTDCSLSANRAFAVPGEGPVNADIMIIGEAPGAQENSSGRPFYGRSGTLLNEMLSTAGISRADTYVTNMIKCWPGEGNPNPPQFALDACDEWLNVQLNLIKPKGIITLGKFSTSKFIPMDGMTMGRIQGVVRKAYWNETDPVFIMPLYHPAYLLRNGAEKPITQGHLNKFKELIYE